MKYLIWSRVGCAIYAIPRLIKSSDTEKVYWFDQTTTEANKLGKGMENYPGWEKMESIKDPMKILNKIDKKNIIIIFDDSGFGGMADHLRKEGFMVVGGGEIADKMETDRWWGLQLAKKIMDIPESYYYDNFDEGIGFLKTRDKKERWVFKPQDNDVPKDKTYVSKDAGDLIETMKRFKEEWAWKDGYVLQLFIEGVLASFNCYFDGESWLPNSFAWYLENKPFMTGDNGPATGGELAVQIWRKNEGPMFEIINKLTNMLKKENYVGQIDVNVIFDEKEHKPYFLEWTPRFGYPGMDLETTALEDNGHTFADLIKNLAFKQQKSLFPIDKVAVALNVSVPPYPSHENADKLSSGLPIKWSKEWDKYFFPTDVMYDKKYGMVMAGKTGQVCTVTCCDSTLKGAVAMTYDTYIPTLEVKDMQFRTDLGEDAEKRLKKLKEWGVLT